ncbi:formylglycine-generating enzyme family protein [Motiliproteus sediminis]|uniref:formylglycine-generating enzyme family protein n=1 Tax=Motiliproteus sediminis TaxID=1468178 RepID=UPI001AF00CD9|nr:formylglycine-generating enzyme family protein [Motiliproteus sediminis]
MTTVKQLVHAAAALLMVQGLPAVADTPVPPREVIINGVEFVYVPEGWFWYATELGSLPPELDPKDGKDHWYKEVKIWQDSYYIAKYEARARHFRNFMQQDAVTHRDQYIKGETEGCGVRRSPDGEYVLVDEQRDLPVTHLSWNLATEFADWMGFRLPTETEWVKAARGTDKRMYPWGNTFPDDTFAGFGTSSGCNSVPVTAYQKGQSPYGAYNMAGNVYEYVQDWFNLPHDLALKDGDRNPVSDKEGYPTVDDEDPSKVLKGGRWASNADGLNVFSRARHHPDYSFVCFGARFAIDTDQVMAHLEQGTAEIVVP